MNRFWSTILIGLLIFTAVVWAAFVIYKSQSDVKINPEANSHVNPISDTFDDETLRKIEVEIARQDIDPDHFFLLEGLE